MPLELNGLAESSISISVDGIRIPSESIRKTPIVPEDGLRLNRYFPSLLIVRSVLKVLGGSIARLVPAIGESLPERSTEKPISERLTQ
jgi:hypothetical protein